MRTRVELLLTLTRSYAAPDQAQTWSINNSHEILDMFTVDESAVSMRVDESACDQREWLLAIGADEQLFAFRRYMVVLGDHNLTSSERSANRIASKQIHIHENFNRATYENNIALVELETEVRLSKFVRTICLSKKNLAIPGSTGRVAGWGATSSVAPGHLKRPM